MRRHQVRRRCAAASRSRSEAHLPKPITGRPDAAILEMKELGDNVFYGG
jgi:hypothetical protein